MKDLIIDQDLSNLSQKRVVRTRFDIYDYINNVSIASTNLLKHLISNIVLPY
jgi:hypothetical protein